MFVIPCKYDSRSPILDSIKSITEIHPTEKIVLVDSGSEDKSYYKDIEEYDNVEILDVSNPYRLIGALKHAYEKYPNEGYYVLMHDSVSLKKSIQSFIDSLDRVKVFMHFSSPLNTLNNVDSDIKKEYIQWMNDIFEKIDYVNDINGYFSNDFYAIFGTMGIYSNDFVKLLDNKKVLENIKAETFNHGQFSERVIGYICKCEGIDISNSIDGDALIKWNDIQKDNLEYIRKRFLSR
jgi:hypothetical protein